MTITWPALAAGFVAILVGVLIMIFRKFLARSSAGIQENMYGELGRKAAEKSTPGRMRNVGIVFVIVGGLCVLASIFLKLQS